MSGIVELTCWKTTDDKLHERQNDAQYHQRQLEAVVRANELLAAGETIGAILREVDYPGEIPEVLNCVSMDSRLVIASWQGQDTPGYQPVRFETEGCIYVYGDAGSDWGPYGRWLTLAALADFASDERSVLAPSVDSNATPGSAGDRR